MMFLLAKTAVSRLQVRSIKQIMVRQSHQKHVPDFHDKYGNAILAIGTTFCAAMWAYTTTQIGIEWNLSLVGKVTPKGWRNQ
ncbi:PREDICTED: cytochrome c oxidase subunit 7B, mitochondrial-like [Elephantulus edwardii]|uniref:cytochrome c oxidase subunit 7B, mitochondrial-like n=1 Tax=Elephantulus edwardii TaxID=28737 RepID=UPI0003F09F1A|nr:PREDICTED: cytochrome c oxidase subunit 7B, mitochondrial-like [Elephantulus edwardii]